MIRLSNKEGHQLDMRKKDHLINFDQSIWNCHAWLGWFSLLTNYWTI